MALIRLRFVNCHYLTPSLRGARKCSGLKRPHVHTCKHFRKKCGRYTSDGVYVPCKLLLCVLLSKTHMPSESYRRRLRSLLLCLCSVFRALINSLVCWLNIFEASANLRWYCAFFDVSSPHAGEIIPPPTRPPPQPQKKKKKKKKI